MLEIYILSAAIAVIVSIACYFVLNWSLHVRVRRLDGEVGEILGEITRAKRQRANMASQEVKASRAKAFDAAVVERYTGNRQAETLTQTEPGEAWWHQFVGGKKDGSVR